MRNWIRNWLNGNSKSDNNRWEIPMSDTTNRLSKKSTGLSTGLLSANFGDTSVIGFRVVGANGGKIVETTRFNIGSGREDIELYLIADGEDFHSSLSKIITIAYLK